MKLSQNSSPEPLRLVFLDSIPTWGGGEAWALETALALAERGHQVTIGAARGAELEARARARGLDVWAAEARWFQGWGALRGARALRAQLAAQRTQVVVANVGRDVRLAALAARGSAVRVVQRRGLARPLRRGPLARRLYGRTLAAVVSNCHAIRDKLLAGVDFVDPDRFHVIPNGVDVPAIAPPNGADREPGALRVELGLAADVPLVLAVARLAPMKGHAVLIEAWRTVVRERPEAVLALAGTGECADELRRASEPLGPSVRWLGFRDDVPELLADSDIFVLASLRDEGSSNALLAAMAAGLPSVVSDLPALVETVGADTARWVPAGAAPALARALLELLGDPKLRALLGTAAWRRARDVYARDVVVGRWERLLARIAQPCATESDA